MVVSCLGLYKGKDGDEAVEHGSASRLTVLDVRHVEVFREVDETEFCEEKDDQENQDGGEPETLFVAYYGLHDVLQDIEVVLIVFIFLLTTISKRRVPKKKALFMKMAAAVMLMVVKMNLKS